MKLFTGADEKEIKRRDAIAPGVLLKEWMEHFLSRKDVKKLPDGSFDVKGSVDLSNLKLKKIPVTFNKVHGSFFCFNNMLETLENAPKYVGRDFYCAGNNKKFTQKEVLRVCEVKGGVAPGEDLSDMYRIVGVSHSDFVCTRFENVNDFIRVSDLESGNW